MWTRKLFLRRKNIGGSFTLVTLPQVTPMTKGIHLTSQKGGLFSLKLTLMSSMLFEAILCSLLLELWTSLEPNRCFFMLETDSYIRQSVVILK